MGVPESMNMWSYFKDLLLPISIIEKRLEGEFLTLCDSSTSCRYLLIEHFQDRRIMEDNVEGW